MTSQRKRYPDDGHRLTRGYFAPCPKCGEVVVFSFKHRRPMHMHWYSKRCRDTYASKIEAISERQINART